MWPAWALQRENGTWPWSAKLTDLLTVLADGARLAARIGFGANGEGEGRVCRECAVFRHRFGSDERHRPMAISSNPLRSTSHALDQTPFPELAISTDCKPPPAPA